MKPESLVIFQDNIIKLLSSDSLKINATDKLELMLNINRFLEPEDYDDNIRVLSENQKKKSLVRNIKRII